MPDPNRARRRLAVGLLLCCGGVFGATGLIVAGARWGVPEGLTGGLTSVALPGGAGLRVEGGFVREVRGGVARVRSQAPRTALTLTGGAAASDPIDIQIENIDPRAVAVRMGGEAIPFEPLTGGAIALSIPAAPGEEVRVEIEAAPQREAGPHFFVFSAVREGIQTFDHFLSLVAAERPDFVIGLGDIYYRADAEAIRALDRQLAGAGAPFYVVPGDDEFRTLGDRPRSEDGEYARFRPRQRFVATFGEPNQVFERGGWRFVFLDDVRKNPRPSPRWIERAIARGGGRRIAARSSSRICPRSIRARIRPGRRPRWTNAGAPGCGGGCAT